jgi:hypothetical protein
MRLVWVVVAMTACAVGRAAGADPVTASLRVDGANAVVEMTIAAGWHVNAHDPKDKFLIPTTVDVMPPAGMRAGAVKYPDAVEKALEFAGGKTLRLYEGKVRLAAPLEGTATDGAPVAAKLRYQACDDTTCLPPKTVELTAPSPRAGPAGPSIDDNEVAGWIERFGWPATLAWVVVLGMALNLTPCVYPLISITVAFFGTTGPSRGTALRAGAYVAGICLTFTLLGAVAALTGSLFGAALQQPVVLGGIALLMVILALGNFGLYQLRPPSLLMQWAHRTGDGVAGALFMDSRWASSPRHASVRSSSRCSCTSAPGSRSPRGSRSSSHWGSVSGCRTSCWRSCRSACVACRVRAHGSNGWNGSSGFSSSASPSTS